MTIAAKQTPLHAAHVAGGARMVNFAGWDMPIQYAPGILQEHLHTRAHAGLFDNKPSASFGGALNNSSDFLPVREWV